MVSLPARLVVRIGYDYYKLAHGGGMPTKIFVAGKNTGCSSHALAAVGDEVYASVYESSPRNIILFKMTVP